MALKCELENIGPSKILSNKFYGREKVIRKFLNTGDGTCHRCNKYAREDEEEFLTLNLALPESSEPIRLSSLVHDHFAEALEQFDMKCSNCCTCKEACQLSGPCKQRPAVMQNILTKTSDVLFIQILRFNAGSATKNLTKISSDNVLELPNNQKFFLEAVICHQGQRASGGHYVSYIRDDGSWLLCDDDNFYKVDHSCSSDSYIFIYRKQLDFQPTNDWQEVQECQAIPTGCVVNMNMETGRKFAKLNKDYQRPAFMTAHPKETTKQQNEVYFLYIFCWFSSLLLLETYPTCRVLLLIKKIYQTEERSRKGE